MKTEPWNSEKCAALLAINKAALADHMRAHQRGFTLLQCIAVTVIGAIGAVVIIPKTLANTAQGTLDYEAQVVASDLRHTQALARSWGRPLVVKTDGVGPFAYIVLCAAVSDGPCTSSSSAVLDPGRAGPFSVTLRSGITLASSLSNASMLSFDSSGRPSQSVVLTLSAGSASRSVSVTAETGKVVIR